MLNFKEELKKIPLDDSNSVVIGSGILNALGIRESRDIDVVVESEKFYQLLEEETLSGFVNETGSFLLTNGVVEISDGWHIEKLGIDLSFEKLKPQSTVIDGVRYANIELVLEIKRLWAREKDIKDVSLIENFLEKNR